MIKRLTSWWFVATVLVLSLLVMWTSIRRVDHEMRENLLQQARMVERSLNVGLIRTLRGVDSDLATAEYQRLKEQLTSVRTANVKCRFVYLMGRQADGTVIFLVDSETVSSRDYSPPGDVLSNPSEKILRVFDAGVSVAEGPITDRWGTWISALVPVRDLASGGVIAVLGMDVDAVVWKWDVAAKAAPFIGLMLILLIGLVTVLLSLRRVNISPKPILRRLLLPLMGIVVLLMVGAGWLLWKQHQHSMGRGIAGSVADISDAEFSRVMMLGGTAGGVLFVFMAGFIYVLLHRADKGIREQQAALKESEESYRNQFAKNSSVMLLTGASGNILDANMAAVRFYGYSRERLLGMLITDINPIPLTEIQRNREMVLQDQKGKLFHFKHRLADGSLRDVEVSLSCIQFGRQSATLSIVHDITERKHVEAALQASEALLNSVGELAKVGGWELDLATGNVRWTRETYLIHEVPVREKIDLEKGIQFYDPEDRPLIESVVKRAVETGEPFDLECRLVTAKGKPLWVRSRGQAITVDGKVVRLTGVFQDITDNKRAETYRALESDILRILNESGNYIEFGDFQDYLQRVLLTIKKRTGFDAVGIRLKNGDDFPYFVHNGFSREFLESENTLVEHGVNGGICRGKDGNVKLECTCGLVISGKTDPSIPLFTRGGSFWTNDSFPLLDLPPEQDPRLNPRNECIHQGYASVALIPIRTGDKIVGLLHYNDHRKGCFSLAAIEQFEGIAAHIGEALMRKQADEQIRTLLAESNQSRRTLLSILEDETKAKANLTRLMAAIEHSSEIIVVTDEHGSIQYVNPAFSTVTGYSRDEVIGRNLRLLKSGRHEAAFYRELWATISRGKTWSGRFVNRKKNGALYTEEATLSPVKDASGSIINYVAVKRDITEELNRQEQLVQAQKMESVGRLAGGVAHDFNNLLMGIMGYADLCRDALPADHPIRHYLDEITKGSQRSADLTRQLLAFARKQTVIPKVLDLNEVVSGMRKLLGRMIGEDIDLAWIPGAGVWPIKIDPSQVDQILANLCINARDAISGVGKITIKTVNGTIDHAYCVDHLDATPGEFVILSVSDSGCGMTQEVMDKVFEPFFTTKATGKGTGLGLATVYGIVRQNNGFIDVSSEPGKGTTFTIYLPRAAGEMTKSPLASSISALPRGTETILLVEDEKSLRVTCGRLLEALGYRVLVAGDPAEALVLAEQHSGDIHLLLTDVIMPGMNGRQLAERLLAGRKGMYCLFMSGYTANVMNDVGDIKGVVHFLQKPFPRDELARKVREVLDGE